MGVIGLGKGLMMHRNLPHKDVAGYYQFVTFRTYDSIDDYLRKLLVDAENSSKKQLRIDEYLDVSSNGAYLNGLALEGMIRVVKKMDGAFYSLVGFCVMPNHVHVLFKPLLPLAEVVRIMKRRSARELNQILDLSGSFWAVDYFDRLIRDERHFRMAYRYIRNNPLKLG